MAGNGSVQKEQPRYCQHVKVLGANEMSKDIRRKKWLTILVAWTIGYWLIVFVLSLLAGSDPLFWGVAAVSFILGLVLSVYNLRERKEAVQEARTKP